MPRRIRPTYKIMLLFILVFGLFSTFRSMSMKPKQGADLGFGQAAVYPLHNISTGIRHRIHHAHRHNFTFALLHRRQAALENRATNRPVTSQYGVTWWLPDVSVERAKCDLLARGEPAALAAASRAQKRNEISGYYANVQISPLGYIRLTNSCATFRASRGYIPESLTSEEREFPLAYSILMYKDVYQFERLLRAIYRPQNHYCVHVDSKASAEIKGAVRAIVGCLDHVFVLPRSYNVRWGTMSVLSPELDCMRELTVKPRDRWQYFINLTGQEWPLQTNWQLVRALRALRGGSIVGGTPGKVPPHIAQRWRYSVAPPILVNLTKGPVHVALPRKFVRYIATDVRAHQFEDWVRRTQIPDETFFSTLYFSPKIGIHGAYNGPLNAWPLGNVKELPVRYKVWQDWGRPCRGRFQRMICVFGLGDLPALTSTHHLFANKLELNYQPMTLDCLEELYFRRVRDEISGTRVFNESVYMKYAYFKYHT